MQSQALTTSHFPQNKQKPDVVDSITILPGADGRNLGSSWPQTPSLSRSCCRNRRFSNRSCHSPHRVPATPWPRRPLSSVARPWQQLPNSLLTSIPAAWLPQSSWRFLVKTGLCWLFLASLTLRMKSPLPSTGPRGPPPHCPGCLFTLAVQPAPLSCHPRPPSPPPFEPPACPFLCHALCPGCSSLHILDHPSQIRVLAFSCSDFWGILSFFIVGYT